LIKSVATHADGPGKDAKTLLMASAAELVRTVLSSRVKSCSASPGGMDRLRSRAPAIAELSQSACGTPHVHCAARHAPAAKTGHAVPKASSGGMILEMLFCLR